MKSLVKMWKTCHIYIYLPWSSTQVTAKLIHRQLHEISYSNPSHKNRTKLDNLVQTVPKSHATVVTFTFTQIAQVSHGSRHDRRAKSSCRNDSATFINEHEVGTGPFRNKISWQPRKIRRVWIALILYIKICYKNFEECHFSPQSRKPE